MDFFMKREIISISIQFSGLLIGSIYLVCVTPVSSLQSYREMKSWVHQCYVAAL